MKNCEISKENKGKFFTKCKVIRLIMLFSTIVFLFDLIINSFKVNYLSINLGNIYIIIKSIFLFTLLIIFLITIINSNIEYRISQYSKYFILVFCIFILISIYIEGIKGYDLIFLIAILTIYNTNILKTGTALDFISNAEGFYERLFNSIKESILILTPKSSKVIFFNLKARESFGISDEKEIFLKDLMGESALRTFNTAVKIIYSYKGVWDGELNMIDKDKNEFPAKVTISYIFEENKELIFLKIIDISRNKYAEKRVEESINELKDKNNELEKIKLAVINVLEDINDEKAKVLDREQRLQTVLESIAEGVIVIDKDRRIVMTNNTILNMLVYSKNEFEGKDYREVVKIYNEEKNEIDMGFIEEMFNNGETFSRFDKSLIENKDGNRIPINETAAPIKDSNGNVVRIVLVVRDATEQRKVENMRKEFVSIASHQLRAPLTGMSWYLEMLLDEKTNSNLSIEQREYINMVMESNKKMIYLVNELLDISRIEGGRELQFVKSDSDFIQLVLDVIEEQKGLASQKNINLIFNKQFEGQLIVNMDRDKIRQAIVNLINNAIKYTRNNGEVIIEVKSENEKVYFIVKDNGIGIPKEQQGRIFEKFFRGDNAVEIQAQGSGLGLYVVKEMIEKHGGNISFISEQNKGTTFTVELPLK